MFIKIPSSSSITVQEDIRKNIKDPVESNLWINLNSILEVQFEEEGEQSIIKILFDQPEKPQKAFYFNDAAQGEFQNLKNIITRK